MIRFKFYRWVRVMLGARTFVKKNYKGEVSYGMVTGSGSKANQMATVFIDMDFVEEWPNVGETSG